MYKLWFYFLVTLVFLSNAHEPMNLTLFGMVTEVKPVQSENVPSPISVTLFGMVTEVKPLQP